MYCGPYYLQYLSLMFFPLGFKKGIADIELGDREGQGCFVWYLVLVSDLAKKYNAYNNGENS